MSIRLRLLLSYIMITFVPLLLGIMLLAFIVHLLGYTDLRDVFAQNRDKSYRQTVLLGEMWYVLNQDSGKLLDESYVSNLDRRLKEIKSGFVYTKPDGGLYTSELAQVNPDPKDWFSDTSNISEKQTVGGYSYSVYNVKFSYPDGKLAKAALIYREDDIPAFWKPYVNLFMLLFVVLFIVLTSYFVARSITRPLATLKNAALSLKEGNLEPVPLPRSRNELGEVGRAFEEMRLRLKATIVKMQQYEENRKMLLSHISHDLKTPITAIKGYVEGIMDGVANTPEKQERYMRTIYNKADAMDRLIDELFLYSKLDLHKEEFHFLDMDLTAFLRHYMEDQQFEMEKMGIQLHLRTENKPVVVRADAEKLSRVLGNMLQNSCKYMAMRGTDRDDPPSVTVGIGLSGSFASLTVEDNGPGIETEALPHLFDRFYRADLSRSSETGGSGLGLSIVRQIVEEHGGIVSAMNRPLGGAAFVILLPLAGGREEDNS